MSEIAACTLIQEEPDRKTERYMMMFLSLIHISEPTRPY